uniref:ARAD1D04246p n=1 Tax=Blastobotrys adeninivorans TaxID=409370 RepID=A0A060TE15_BLAAD
MNTIKNIAHELSPFKPVYSDGYPDQSGRTWIVTGVSVGGIGFETARLLLTAGAKLWIVGRNVDKLDQSVRELKKDAPNADVSSILIDFNDLTTVKPGLQQFLSEVSELHGVVHNAGIMFPPVEERTKQDFDKQLGVNVVAPFLIQRYLDNLLIATAKKSPPNTVRVVWLSSAGHLAAPKNGIDWSDINLDKSGTRKKYFYSKALNVMEAILWSQKHENSGVLSVSVHPGMIHSDLARHMSSVERYFASYVAQPVVYGAYTEIYAAVSPDLTVEKHSDAYIVPYGRVGIARTDLVEAAEGKEGDKFWQWLTEVTDPYM